MSKQSESYAKAMKGAMADAEKKGTLGIGFGGEEPKKPMTKASPVVKALGKMKSC